MSGLIGADSIVYLPFATAYDPQGGLVEVYRDYWWEAHPEKGLVFFRRNKDRDAIAQCNRNEAIVRKVAESKEPALGHVVLHCPLVFVPKRLEYSREQGAYLATHVNAWTRRSVEPVEPGIG